MEEIQLIVPRRNRIKLFVQKSETHLLLPELESKKSQEILSSNSTTRIENKQQEKKEEIIFPMKSSTAFRLFRKYLTNFEKTEITNYKQIYYIRQFVFPFNNSPKKKDQFFRFYHSDHIFYRYEQLTHLGQGSFGSVIRCFDHLKKEYVAIKLIKDSPKTHYQLKSEYNILKYIQSVGKDHSIVKYLDVFEFRGFYCLVMELLGTDLFSFLKSQNFKSLNIDLIRIISKQTADALNSIHSIGVIHCDLKPENIIFSNHKRNSIKIIDFGCSCFENKTLYTYVQSRFYRSPEIILGIPYDRQVDIWSYGCLLAELALGYPLFPAETEEELFNMIIESLGEPPRWMIEVSKDKSFYLLDNGLIKPFKNKYGKKFFPNSNPLKEKLSTLDLDLKLLILNCLEWDPKLRIKSFDILNHSFLNNFNTIFKEQIKNSPRNKRPIRLIS